MFSFIKQYAEKIDGVHVYAYISLFIILVFFIILLVLVKKMGKDRVNELSNIPFDKEEINNSTI